MTEPADDYLPHPHIGGRANALRALATWRTGRPGAPRVVIVTGDSGSGRSRLLTGFLMLCDPDFRKQLLLDRLDPSTVPPELPAPAAANARGLTAAQFLWALADHYELETERSEDVYSALAALGEPVPLVVLDADEAGPVRSADEPTKLVREVLMPLAALDSVRLVVELPRPLAGTMADGLPAGTVQIMDLDDPQWADPEVLLRHADAALSTQFGAPELPFTVDPGIRRALAAAIAHQADTSALVVQLTVQSVLTAPEGFDPTDRERLPTSVASVVDWHAQRLGADPGTLRMLLTPLALAESDGVPVDLWPRLVSAVAGQDMSGAVASGMLLVGPFVQLVEASDDPTDERTLLRLAHPAIGDALRGALPQPHAVQSRIAIALLEAVPDQDWGKAAPYVRDGIAGHALGAGLLPQLLTDPGLFVHADPIRLRAAVEAVPLEALGAAARTYLRTAPLLTRNELSELGRAALLETAFVEDGLAEYAEATHRLGLELPWQTLWSLPVSGIDELTVAELPAEDGTRRYVAVLVVPAGTPGAWGTGQANAAGSRGALLVHDLVRPELLPAADPALLMRPSEDDRATAAFGLSQGADYIRVWDRAAGDMVTALLSDVPFSGADLSPDGILLIATERGAKALRIHAVEAGIAS
ncbi:ATP-binding protein [Streptomyces sp. NPDC093591]|uniref:ATP-binding protein n=1 Tax=Streptomyces sp. NPDC093591 TaxID=3366044 RepID=UPI00380C9D57